MQHSKIISLSCVLIACLSLTGCASLGFSHAERSQAVRESPAPVIYVDDFHVGAHAFQTESGVLPLAPLQASPLGNMIPRVLGWPEQPALRIQELTELMSASLVEDLQNAGFDARRLRSGDKLPARGWLVRGTFTQMNEGNRLRRSLIGLGAGRTQLVLVVNINRVVSGTLQSPYALNASATSSRRLGAIFTMDPYAAAADFMSCGLDLDNNVMQTATKITAEISGYVNNQPPHTT